MNCTCGHPADDHGPDGCLYPSAASSRLVFCECIKPGLALDRWSLFADMLTKLQPIGGLR